MPDWLEFLTALWPVHLLVLAWFTGRAIEMLHFRSIHDREAETAHIPVVTFRNVTHPRPIDEAHLAIGSAVVAVDHFKRFLGAWRNLFGGELRSFSSVIDRGRREAVLRMKEANPDADIFVNFRFETAVIVNSRDKAQGCVEIVAYSTAVRYRR